MSPDVGQSGLQFCDAMRIGGVVGLGEQFLPLAVSRKDDVDEPVGTVGSFLRKALDAVARWNTDSPVLGGNIAGDGTEQGGFTAAIAADKADTGAGRDLHRRALEQRTACNANRKVVDNEHRYLAWYCRTVLA